MPYRPSVIDVPITGLSQSEPEHGGPEGRTTALKNAQVTHYTPASRFAPQTVRIEAREAFVSMPATLHASDTGAVDATSSWSNPELLAALGDQLLSINNSTPRAFNGTNWTSYPATRVLTNKLSQDVIHTTNHTIQAPDSARIGTTTCFVWTETIPNAAAGTQYQATVAFRADDGAWVRTPLSLYITAPSGSSPTYTLARVVTDGTLFYVFVAIGISSKMGVFIFGTDGVVVAQDVATIPMTWAVSPGYWDVQAVATGGARLVQPSSNTTTGANVGASVWFITSALVITSAVIGGAVVAKCSGPIAFLDNGANPTRLYIATLGVAGALFAYEFNLTTGAGIFEYSFGAVVNGSGIPDSMTGWMETNGAGPIAHVAFSVLSNFSPPAGPANDPGLRHTRAYACTRAGVVTLVNQTNGVLLSSRAFRIDLDWYAAVYYQSGGGTSRGAATTPPVTDGTTDYLIGSAEQPLIVNATDIIIGSKIRATATAGLISTGAPAARIISVPSQAIATITHNAGDSAVAATQTWTFLNAAFVDNAMPPFLSAFNSYLRVSGSSHAANNADFRVIQRVSATVIVTEALSKTGTIMVDDTLAGVTGVLISTTTIAVTTEELGSLIPPGAETYYAGNLITTGFTAPANNTTFACFRVITNQPFPQGPAATQGNTMFLCTPVGTNVYGYTLPGGTIEFQQVEVNKFGLFSDRMITQDIGNSLVVTGTPQNDGAHVITSIGTLGSQFVAVAGGDVSAVPQLLLPPLPTIKLVLADPAQAFHMHVAAGAFDASYKGAYITFIGGGAPPTSGAWQVTEVLSATDLVLTPVDGRTGIRSSSLSLDSNMTITRTTNQPSAIQPCWYLMPLSIAQRAAGRWDWGVAYADWRFDGEAKGSIGTFERNAFPLALSSITPSADGLQFVLPYRAQSFTAGQVQSGPQTQTGLSITAQSTVGLKLFDLSNSPGQPVAGDGAMLLPGPQASQYSATGFPESGINLGAELPFLVSQATVGAVALTLNTTCQYVVDFEVTDESGDRVWSTVSQVLEVTLRGTQNKNVIGGRMPGPTNRIVGVCIYRTANVGGAPTIQHYKITNDLDVNGTGFTFTSVNGGAQFDTWQYADVVPDPQILSSEVVYTDKALLQRFPAPAYRQGVSGWKARDWVVGYDGAVWMSDEKVEGDAVWWTPAFRYTAFGDDRPVSVCPMDDYLIVHCKRTVWYIPATTFPDATGRNGILPTPVQLPFQNGGTGVALAIRAGVVYASTAGGVWLITRDLQNLWLSEAVKDSLTTVNSMAVDGKQRLWVTTGTPSIFVYDQVTKGWWEWLVPGGGAAQQVATFGAQAAFVNSFGTAPLRYTPGAYLDNLNGTTYGIAQDITMAGFEFGGVRSYKCLWACHIVGTYKGPHRLNVVMSYPDDDQADTVYPPFTPSGVGPYIFEVNPMLEEVSAIVLRIFGDFVGVATPGNSFTLEFFSFEVGLESGINRIQPGRRIPGG